ncbi:MULTISPECIES: hypothetical protein [Bradyrhizobium]|jgi:hypothetical protein|uniref:hypothetical protein n=2 Tax=Bradyrhizobium TaxID=374 RepID=UPI000488BC7C|nr:MULTISPECIES: hypothetical protein [Bradyrhizobium]MDI2055626.1 hypothetical protein [Bradyrhizobium sp. Mp19]MCS3449561.1 hypothetical protein [Bradyrhizobium elkanii]MCS3559296.1 hypothetical protein [Bradyrhizobium elkanii]MCW2150858.1 hypothetical protein [Bradyrhizobium elkanii]MCW2374589.1 hypothetical protein [Bradyrhizobium elkanii]
MAFLTWLASTDMTSYRSHVLVGFKKIVNFRKRMAAKSDGAITATLNYLLDKQRSAIAIRDEKDRRKAQ